MKPFETELKKLRQQIDVIDDAIIEKIMRRLSLSWQVGKLKKQHNQNVFHLQREQDIIKRMLALKEQILPDLIAEHKGSSGLTSKDKPALTSKSLSELLSDQALRVIYHEIISASRATQNPLRVGYLGAPGSFSHIASLELFGSSSEHVPYASFHHVFQAIQDKKESLALIPIENSTEGIVGATVDLMVVCDIEIIMECFMPINLSLLSKSKLLSGIQTLVSHAQPLSQAQQWINEYLPDVVIKEAKSTAHAAELALKNQTYACIASKQLAFHYPELHILRNNIEDTHHNTTRFLVIKDNRIKDPNLSLAYAPVKKSSPPWITTLIFSTGDQSGSLHEVLRFFKHHNLNMTHLVSRPSKKKAFEYLFYVDFLGHHEEPHIKKALNSIKKHTQFLKLLGSYPRGRHTSSTR